ncbi:MAG TPA: formate dehydrogenase accessory protein FdhE [Methylomirabilota bacterium]|nr:formate dehydrogenase accessory protein FdhE [Methylomirabilota bacterium]
MPDYSALLGDWHAILTRRAAMAEPLGFWTAVLEGWAGWKPPATLVPLTWTAEECRRCWERSSPLLAEATPSIAAASIEELLGPIMERLAADGPDTVAALRRFAEAWDRGEMDVAALLPRPERDPVALLQERFALPSALGAFLPLAALRPALEAYFEGVRDLPDGVWTRGACPWCGGAAAFGDLVEDGRRRLSCHLCGGAWIAARLRCPFCETWNSRDLVRLVAEELEEGYFIEACRACRGYLKGVDRRQRWNAGSPLVEDWGSPHLDVYAAREGYWRSTPSLAHLLPPPEEPA